MTADRLPQEAEPIVYTDVQAPAETPEKTPTGYNRPPNGEPAHPEDWNAGYEAGFADGHEAGAHADKLPIAWMYEHDGSLDEPILTVDRWPECSEPWNETPLDALALAKHAIEKVWLDAVGTGHGEHSISEVARKRVEFAADALKLGLRLPGALRKTGVETPVSQAQPKGTAQPFGWLDVHPDGRERIARPGRLHDSDARWARKATLYEHPPETPDDAWEAARQLSNQSHQDFIRGVQWATQRGKK